MESEAVVDVTGGVFTYEKIIHRPLIRLPKEAAQKRPNLPKDWLKSGDIMHDIKGGSGQRRH